MSQSRKKSSVVLCGHSKCGTRWLTEVLKTNPHVRVIDMRRIEPKYEEELRDILRTEERFVYFDHPYAIQNEDILQLLVRLDPDMRAVIIYREPIDAMLSMHNYSRPAYGKQATGGPDYQVSFDEFVSDANFVSSMKEGQLHNIYQAEYQYDRNAANLRKYFKTWKELLYDDLKNDRPSFLAEFFGFTRFPPVYEEPAHPVNQSLAYRSYLAHRILMKTYLLLTGMDTKQPTLAYSEDRMRPSLLKFLMNLNSKNTHFLTSSDVKKLRAVTGPMVERFSKATDLDLKGWGYKG